MISELRITISNSSGPQGSVQVLWDRWDGARPGFQYRIESGIVAPEVLAYGHDLWLGSGQDPNHVAAAETLLAFLESEGEKYRYAMSDGDTSAEGVEQRTGDGYLFNELTAEWAYGLSDELSMARLELAGDEPS